MHDISKYKWVCPQCDGYGYIMIEEDFREVQHACYHCGTEGYLPYDPDIGDPREGVPSDDELNEINGELNADCN